MDVLTRRKPIQQMKYIQISPADPPLTRPIVATLIQEKEFMLVAFDDFDGILRSFDGG